MRVGRLVWIVAFGLAVGVAGVTCGGQPDGRGHGVVQDLDPEARRITLEHGDIPGVMKGMTMTFELSPDVALDDIAAGAQVDFRVQEQGGVYTVTELQRSGS